MQFNTHTVTTEQSFHIPDIQIPVEGTIPLPEGIAPIQTVLDIAGTAEVSEVSVCDGKLYLEGVAHFKILYLDAHNEFTGFDAETEFSHLHDLEYTDQLVQTLAWCRLGELNHTVTDGHSVYIQCLVEAETLFSCNRSYPVLDPGTQDRFLQHRTADVTLSRLGCMRTGKTCLSTQVRVPQSLPAVKRVLSEHGYAILHKIVPEEGHAALEGELRLFIVYESTDKNAPLQYLEETLPFSDIIADDALQAHSKVFAIAGLESVATQPDTQNTDILNISAVIHLCLSCHHTHQESIVEDLYHEQQDIRLDRVAFHSDSISDAVCTKKVLRLSAELPSDTPEVSRVLFARAYPRILNAHQQDGTAMMEGILTVTLCYTTMQSGIRSTQLQLPFETEVAYTALDPSAALQVYAFGAYTVAEGSGKELELKACLDLCIHEARSQTVYAVQDAALEAPAARKQTGIFIYYADGKESLWDIAKKFKINRQIISTLPETDVPPQGHKLILVSR